MLINFYGVSKLMNNTTYTYFYQPKLVYTIIFWSWDIILLSFVFIVQLEEFKLNYYTPIIALIYIIVTLVWLFRMHIKINNKELIIYRFIHHKIVLPIKQISIKRISKRRILIITNNIDFGNIELLMFPYSCNFLLKFIKERKNKLS